MVGKDGYNGAIWLDCLGDPEPIWSHNQMSSRSPSEPNVELLHCFSFPEIPRRHLVFLLEQRPGHWPDALGPVTRVLHNRIRSVRSGWQGLRIGPGEPVGLGREVVESI